VHAARVCITILREKAYTKFCLQYDIKNIMQTICNEIFVSKYQNAK